METRCGHVPMRQRRPWATVTRVTAPLHLPPTAPLRRRLLVAASLFGCLPGAALRAQGALEKPRLTLALGGRSTLYFLPITIAEQLGYFAEEGLELELQDHAGGGLAQRAMLAGEADLVAGAYEHTIVLRQRGRGCRAFVQFGRAPQSVFGIGKRVFPDFQDLGQLKGRRVGISAADSATEWFARLVLARGRLAASAVELVGVGTSTAAASALREGRIDALVNVDPVVSLLELGGELRVIADARSLRGTQELFEGPMPGGCLYAPQGFIVRYPRTVQALANAVVRALKWLQTAGPSDIVRTVPEVYMSGDRATYLSALEKVREAFSPDGLLPEQAVTTAHAMIARFAPDGVAVRAPAPAATYTNEFVQRARQKYAN